MSVTIKTKKCESAGLAKQSRGGAIMRVFIYLLTIRGAMMHQRVPCAYFQLAA